MTVGMAEDDCGLYNVKGAAKRCKTHPATIYRAVRLGLIPQADGLPPIWIYERDLIAWDTYRMLLRGIPKSPAQRIARIIQALSLAFEWDSSPEGDEYWRSVAHRLWLRMLAEERRERAEKRRPEKAA